MITCKICKIVEETGNDALLRDANSSDSCREVANRWQLFGKSTVNKHRMNCSVQVSQPVTPDESEYQSVEWSGDDGVLKTGMVDESLGSMSHDEILRMFGHDPETVEITGLLKERHSQYWSRDLNKMLWKHTYSFALSRRGKTQAPVIDPLEILRSLRVSPVGYSTPNWDDDSTFVLDWSDWQTGKAEGGGTEAFIVRFQGAIKMAIERVEHLRQIGRSVKELVIIGGGDMVEGCVIYPQQSFHIDMNRREQIRFTVATILEGLYALSPMFDSVRVVVAPGNHGEHRINGNRTAIGDNDDLLVFEMAEVAVLNDPNMQHVKFEIAERELSITTKIRGWVYGVTHGDVFGKGAGAVNVKAFNWFKMMAANRHEVGMSDVLVTHHFHHEAMADWGKTLWIQSPALDGGSAYFREATGHDAESGMMSWVVTTRSKLQDKQILR